MTELYQALAERVAEWRSNGYPCSYPAIAEILEYAVENEREGFRYPLSGNLRFLRQPQLRALETYWYLRLVQNTPRVRLLYAELFAKPSERRKALGLDGEVFSSIARRRVRLGTRSSPSSLIPRRTRGIETLRQEQAVVTTRPT